jgi:predicted exporter
VTGLEQLACFTIVGLAVASLATRYGLPVLLPDSKVDYGESQRLASLWSRVARLPRPAWLIPVLAALFGGIILVTPGEFWESNLGKLTPIPENLIARDTVLRRELDAPDIRYLLAVHGGTADEVLTHLRALQEPLNALVATHAISGFDDATHYLAPTSDQLRRQAQLPPPDELRATLTTATAGLPFRANVFEPFLKDVETARHLPPLTPRALVGTALALRLGGLIIERDKGWTGLVTFSEVQDAQSLRELAAQARGTIALLDLKQASEDLVVHQRERILLSLAMAAALLVAVIAIALRSLERVGRVLAPMTLTTLLILAVLHGSGVALNLFHLIALVLAAGLGLDYALFFEHAAHDPREQRRTLHAVIVCSISTFVVFAVLALSSLPVLRAIGVTVALGVLGNFVLSLLLSRPRAAA